MNLRLMQAAAFLVLAACGAAPSQSSAQSSGERPFTVTPVATLANSTVCTMIAGSKSSPTGSGIRTKRAVAEEPLTIVSTKPQPTSAAKIATKPQPTSL